jgi:hypothetical protein
MAMLAAVVEPDALGTTCTSSPTARSAMAAVTRSFVTVVDEVMV